MTPRIPPNSTPGADGLLRPGKPVLRLVNTRGMAASATRPRPEPDSGWPSVAAANVAAARFAGGLDSVRTSVGPVAPVLGETDPRWLLAIKAGSLLEGGKAGLLTPTRRKIVMALAHQLRLRPFDANLVIAIVQDSARAGERLVSPAVKSRLTLVGATSMEGEGAGRSPGLWGLCAGVLLGLVVMLALIAWVLGGM